MRHDNAAAKLYIKVFANLIAKALPHRKRRFKNAQRGRISSRPVLTILYEFRVLNLKVQRTGISPRRGSPEIACFEQNNSPALTSKIQCGHKTGDPASNDRDVMLRHADTRSERIEQ
jgi:hypothetical protein